MTWKRDAMSIHRDGASVDKQSGRTGDDRMESERIIIVSNRGPVNFEHDPETGALVGRPGAGGVVSGLLAATQGRQVTWIALAMNDADREFARANATHVAPTLDAFPNIALRLVDMPEDVFRRYYDGISNQVLWFTQHYLLQPGVSPVTARAMTDWDEGYCAVNEAVARATLREMELTGELTPVLFQDYHLYLAPGIVREQAPWARLAHFVHIPWPEPRYWEMLPETLTQAIFSGLAASDIAGFQTERDARNFVDGARRFLYEAEPAQRHANESGALLIEGRRVSARVYPIAATPAEVFAQANGHEDPETEALLAKARPTPDHKIILRVDRVEPTKNIITGFRAFERMLNQHKRLRERVTFVALLVPSREELPEYRAVMRETKETIARINKRFGTPDWQPIIAIFGNDRSRALAVMREYDALLVNPLIDGMNLVVKEAALVNERKGVVVLSRTAGAYEQLGQYVLGVPPADTQAIASALHDALTMPRRERQARSTALVNTLMRESAAQWLQAQLRDLAAQTARPQVTLEAGGRAADWTRGATDDAAAAGLAGKRPAEGQSDALANAP
ncbi:MAG TPA: trehalose-6-phosphate synthase [Ktedonobacterales bacterium]|nr:trehalose-6-phosphate synthase [Ktedonobacterales bacterium]